MTEGNANRTVWIVDDLRIDPGARSVYRGDERIELPRLSFDLLLALIEQAPDAVSIDQLMDRVWTGRVVSPATVAKRVELVRSALGGETDPPRYIELVRSYGYRLVPTAQAEIAAPGTDRRTDRPLAAHRWPIALITAVMLGLLAVTLAVVFRTDDPPPPERSIAVLPFRSLSADPADQQFADGLSEEIAHSLANTGSLMVAGRRSSFQFRDGDRTAEEIGAALGVAHLLEGSIRRSGDSLRVVAQLIDSRDGLERWSDSWERPMADVIALQKDISERVAAELQVALADLPGRRDELADVSPEAYALFLQAISMLEYPAGSDMPRGQALLERAVALDPNFATAWAYLGAAHLRRSLWNEPSYELSRQRSIAVARDAVDRALAADPANGWAYGLLAGMAWGVENDTAKAARLAEQSARLQRADLTFWKFSADLYKSLGQLEKARAIEERILRRDPLCIYCRSQHLATLNALGDHAEAIRQARTLVGLSPPERSLATFFLGRSLLLAGDVDEAITAFQSVDDEPLRRSGLAMAHHTAGDEVEARSHWQQLAQSHPGPPGAHLLAQVASWIGEHDRALELLNEMIQRPDFRLNFQINYTSPMFRGLHDTPGWAQLLERIDRSPEQIQTIGFDVIDQLALDP